MKFATRQEADLPAEKLFDAISDFSLVERMLMNKRAQVRRLDPQAQPGVGMAWQIGFDLRGKRRDLRLAVVNFDRPENIRLDGESEMFQLTVDMTVIALTPAKSRLIFEVEAKPRNMRARLMLQTAKLGKTQLDRQFAERIAEYLAAISGPYKQR